MMAYTMRYAAELRNPADYFRDIKHHSISTDSLDLAKELIKRKAGKFDPSKFVDGYEVAVKELVDAKLKHAPIPHEEAPAHTRGKVINLMDALRKSVATGAKPEHEEASAHAAKKSEPRKGPTLVKSAAKPPAKHQPKSAKPAAKRKTA
jgi:DNA end-binding protein Ku